MSRIIFDIETVGLPWEDWDESTREYLLRRSGPEAGEDAVRERLGLSAATGKIVAIGMLNPDTGRGGVYYELPEGSETAGEEIEKEGIEEEGIRFRCGSEEEILRYFWKDIGKYSHWITYNGRTFDIPFLTLRSLILGITPSKTLDSPRYRLRPHCDLMEVLSFFGATRPFSLSFWCRTMGVEDPKGDGIDGSVIGELYGKGNHLDIARYCLRDVRATAELFRVVEERYLSLRSDWA